MAQQLILLQGLRVLGQEPVASGVIDGCFGALRLWRSHLPLEVVQVAKTAASVVPTSLRLAVIN